MQVTDKLEPASRPDTTAVAFESLRTRVDARLAEFLGAAVADAQVRALEALPIMTEVRDLTVRGGKRLRAAMVMAAVECTASWETVSSAVIDVACAVELLQTYLLIHDDWMDGDTIRRGGPTVHVALTRSFGGEHLGAAGAILAGDMASSLAQQLAASEHVAAARLHGVIRAFSTMQYEVVLGQTLDVVGSTDGDALHDLKTGSYTVRGPLALGHAVAGGTAETWASLDAFSRPLGIAFQLRDDLIGTFGDENETGKSSASDLRAGKRTAPVAVALERLDAEHRRELEALLGTDKEAGIQRARELIESVDARRVVEDRIAGLRERAMQALEAPALRPSGRAMLGKLATTMTDRRK